MEKRSLNLPKEVAEKFSLKNIEAGNYHFPGFGEINLTSITLEKANSLFAAGFPFLVEKKKRMPVTEEK